MLQNDVSRIIYQPNFIVHPFEDRDPGVVFGTEGGIIRTYVLSKALGQVETKAVEVVFPQPIRIHGIDKGLGVRTFVVEVIEYAVRMRGRPIEEGIIGGRSSPIAVQFYVRKFIICLVE